MLHWARSFSIVGVMASMFTLGLYPAPLGVVALGLTGLFVTLAVLALVTDILGKTRNGTYSAERALALVALGGAAVWAAVRFSGLGAAF